jgi:hypothetical protein
LSFSKGDAKSSLTGVIRSLLVSPSAVAVFGIAADEEGAVIVDAAASADEVESTESDDK